VKMELVLANFDRLCDSPAVWAILGLMTLRVAVSVIWFFRCPVVRQTERMDPMAARLAVDAPFVHSPRFLVTMIVGIALSVGGLYAMQIADIGPAAVAAIMIGVFLLIVEPSRLSVEENTRRASASRLDGDDAYSLAHERLRSAHVERIALEVGMVMLMLALVIAGAGQ